MVVVVVVVLLNNNLLGLEAGVRIVGLLNDNLLLEAVVPIHTFSVAAWFHGLRRCQVWGAWRGLRHTVQYS